MCECEFYRGMPLYVRIWVNGFVYRSRDMYQEAMCVYGCMSVHMGVDVSFMWVCICKHVSYTFSGRSGSRGVARGFAYGFLCMCQ